MKALLIIIYLCISSGSAWAANWSMQPDASRLAFTASYQGEAVPGEFRHFQTRLTLDPNQPERGALHVDVDVTSLDLGSGELNDGAATAEWFDLAQFPKAEFQSEQIRQVDGHHYVASGSLKLKGVERRIDLPFEFQTDGSTAAMTGSLEMQRSWFHIGSGDWASEDPIGLKVQVNFNVKLRHDD